MSVDWTHGVSGVPARMCSQCHRVLNTFTDTETGTSKFIHSIGNDCHKPFLPLPIDDRAVLVVCDFCSSPVPRHTAMVKCEPFGWQAAPEVVAGARERENYNALDPEMRKQMEAMHFDDGQWAACDVCADLIRAGQWETVTDHAMYCYERLHGEMGKELRERLREEMGQLHGAIRMGYKGMETL